MKCNYCLYEWEPIKKVPKACPRCKRYLWHNDKVSATTVTTEKGGASNGAV